MSPFLIVIPSFSLLLVQPFSTNCAVLGTCKPGSTLFFPDAVLRRFCFSPSMVEWKLSANSLFLGRFRW